MKVVISVNANAKRSGENLLTSLYGGTYELSGHFMERGHDVSVVCPSEVVDSGNAVFEREYVIEGDNLVSAGTNVSPFGDVFFMRGFGQDAESVGVTERFFETMGRMEGRFNLMVNSPRTAWYDLKNNQKELDVPFIPSAEIGNFSDLEESLMSGNRVVAKPNSGFMGRGVLFLDDAVEARKCFAGLSFAEYSFEKWVPGDEHRIIFLDGEPIIKRVLYKTDFFGIGNTVGMNTVDVRENPRELEVARKIIRDVGAFYGCVDFRGQGSGGRPQVLEYNGSGTNPFCRPDPGMGPGGCYELSEMIVKKIEEKVR
jgi:hypothetical protein